MEFLRKLLQDTAYALDIATHLHFSHDSIQPGRREAFETTGDDTARVQKTGRQMKIATSIAGFYAMETALNYLVTTRKGIPSEILQSLVDKKLSDNDEMIFARFANATWKAGQPFRDLNRISRATFTPFYFLSEPDIEKDLVQVRAAARLMLQHLKE